MLRSFRIILIIYFFPQCLYAEHPQEGVVVIVVNKISAVTNITKEDLLRLYSGKGNNVQGARNLFIVNRPEKSLIRKDFYHFALQVKPTKKFFKFGKITTFAPMEIKTDQAMLRFIKVVPNAIGYVYLHSISDSNNSVKILKVDGYLPDQDNYPLQ